MSMEVWNRFTDVVVWPVPERLTVPPRVTWKILDVPRRDSDRESGTTREQADAGDLQKRTAEAWLRSRIRSQPSRAFLFDDLSRLLASRVLVLPAPRPHALHPSLSPTTIFSPPSLPPCLTMKSFAVALALAASALAQFTVSTPSAVVTCRTSSYLPRTFPSGASFSRALSRSPDTLARTMPRYSPPL